jgi:hypothetical protein
MSDSKFGPMRECHGCGSPMRHYATYCPTCGRVRWQQNPVWRTWWSTDSCETFRWDEAFPPRRIPPAPILPTFTGRRANALAWLGYSKRASKKFDEYKRRGVIRVETVQPWRYPILRVTVIDPGGLDRPVSSGG